MNPLSLMFNIQQRRRAQARPSGLPRIEPYLVRADNFQTAGKAYTRATITTAAALACIDAVKTIARTIWAFAVLATAATATAWAYLHWHQIKTWLT